MHNGAADVVAWDVVFGPVEVGRPCELAVCDCGGVDAEEERGWRGRGKGSAGAEVQCGWCFVEEEGFLDLGERHVGLRKHTSVVCLTLVLLERL